MPHPRRSPHSTSAFTPVSELKASSASLPSHEIQMHLNSQHCACCLGGLAVLVLILEVMIRGRVGRQAHLRLKITEPSRTTTNDSFASTAISFAGTQSTPALDAFEVWLRDLSWFQGLDRASLLKLCWGKLGPGFDIWGSSS